MTELEWVLIGVLAWTWMACGNAAFMAVFMWSQSTGQRPPRLPYFMWLLVGPIWGLQLFRAGWSAYVLMRQIEREREDSGGDSSAS